MHAGGACKWRAPRTNAEALREMGAWIKELGEEGHIQDPGHPLESIGGVVMGKQKAVHDGPYAEAILCGLSITPASSN